MSNKEDLSLTEQIEKFFIDEIEKGYQITDKESMVKIKKLAVDKFKLKKGNYGLTIVALDRAMAKKDIKPQLKETTIEQSGVKATVKKEELPKVEPKPEIPSKTVPQEEIKPEAPAREPLSPETKQKYERMLYKTFSTIDRLYAKFGLIEIEEKELSEEEKKDLEYNAKTLAKDWADFCFENQIRLPTWLELLGLIAATAIYYVTPVVALMFFGRKKKEQEEKEDKALLEKVKVK